MGVVVRDVETVDPGARKNDEVRKRDGHTRRAGTIGELHRPMPDLRRDLVVGKQRLVTAKRLALGVVGDATPQFESHGRTPRGFAALEERRLVVRRPSPEDARSSLVEITGDGRQLLAGTRAEQAEAVARLLTELDDDQLALLAGAIEPLERVVYGPEAADATLRATVGI